MRLAGKIALITGGARGMGAAHARAFVAEGASVAITDIRAEEGEKLAAELGDAARFYEHDVVDEAAWNSVVAATENELGPISVLVNNAGTAVYMPLELTPLDEYRRIVDINQTACFLGMKAAVPSLRRAGGGSIINVSSVAGVSGPPLTVAYSASKWAVVGMTKVAAKELGPDGIRVNAIHPGVIETAIFDELPEAVAGALQQMVAATPLGRAGQPDEVSGLVVFLASDESCYITGASHIIDGGLMP